MSCLIVGASLAGGRAAEALREHGFAGRVTLLGAEPDRPYERPPLSKEYLRREMADEKLYLRPANWYQEQQIELRTGMRATRLDSAAPEVELESGERIAYEQLLIATGCEARRLTIPGAGLDGVHYLRTRVEAADLAAALAEVHRVVVVGAGFIGSEVAASARMLGREVTVLEMAAIPLSGALGMRVGEACAALHRDHGVDLRFVMPARRVARQGTR
jgi:3-phenylpropionate/trans-cinnamate dioxygenase ferredoxin reductase component